MIDALRRAISIRVEGSGELPITSRYETHSAIILLVDEFALKVRKPVNLGFLDYSTHARRSDATGAELSLGRRISPWVYVGEWSLIPGSVPTVTREPRQGEPVLAMQALDERERLDRLVSISNVPAAPPRFDELADFCAAFHARCPVDRSPAGWGDLRNTWHAWGVNFTELPENDSTVPLPVEARRHLTEDTRRWWGVHESVMRQRVLDGRIRDGHGDLRIEHVYLGERVSLIDPLEFSQRLRFADVASEVGFIVMELQEVGRTDLALRFIDRYQDASGDDSLRDVLPFFVRYRAVVRGKVEWIRATQLAGTAKQRALARSRALFDLALSTALS